MANTLECPNCGAPLDDIPSGSLTTKCTFCHSNVLLPVELLGAINQQARTSIATSIQDHADDLMRITSLARSGNTAEAMHIYREIFDTSQAESKSAIDDILSGKPVMLPGQKRLIPTSSSQTGLLLTIVKKYSNDDPDEAIQLFMDAYGTDPDDSRNFIEKLAAGSLVELPDGTSFQIAQGFINMTRASSPTETLKNRKSINIISIIAITGIVIGLIAAGIVAVFSLTKEKAPEALFAPLLTPLPDPSTATTIPFASPVFTFGGEGTGAGLFSDARTIGVDRQGKIYVGDIETRLVQVFDPDGNYLTQWHTGQKDDGKDLFLAGMAVDLNGQVYIASSDAIHIYNGQTGERLGILTYPGNGYFEDVTITPDGSVVAVYFTHQENIIRFNKNGEVDLYLESPIGNVTDHSELDTTVAVDGVGNIYLLGSFNNMAFIYNRDGKYQNKFGGDGEGHGTFQAVDAIAVDNQSRIYVSDINGIQIFDPNGRYLETFEIQPGARAMTFDLKGNLYVLAYPGIITKWEINHRMD